MSVSTLSSASGKNIQQQREDLACAFRWAARLNLHEAVANHFSLAVSDDGTQFLMNPNQRHFSLIRASELLLLDARDPATMKRVDAPDPTAWGLHGSIHRNCPHARCVLHLHPTYSTILASLTDSTLPPIDQNTAMFYGRYVIDQDFSGLAFESEGERCSTMLADPKTRIMIMGNHGVLAIGETVAEAFNQMYYFERAAENYIKALWTQRPLRELPEAVAEKVSHQIAHYPGQSNQHFEGLREILDREEPDYKD